MPRWSRAGRAAIRFEWRYERSQIVQVVSLAAGADAVEFDTFIDWQEQHTLLKAAFPLALATDESIAEIQFGHVARASHANTNWDAAKFELPMLRWVAMEEPGFGVALLNDCKYGYDAKGTTLRLTLLRAPTYPWDGADIGTHRFRYAAMLHGGVATGAVQEAAEAFDAPMSVVTGEGTAAAPEIATMDNAAISIEAVKLAEEGGAVVLRLVERLGARAETALRPDPAFIGVRLANLLEEPLEALPLEDGLVALRFRPFEIKTILLYRES
jgi:alpha-mannosidase